jgi:sugar lactone lactonase YvrE
MNGPFGVAVDKNGTLWVADNGNNRVLRFNNAAAKPAFAINADGVLGQPDYSTKTILTPPTQASMSGPRALTVDADGTLWVADFGNNRVLRFDTAASAINGGNADGVLGAPGFTVNFGGVTTQYAMNGPDGVAADAAGHLWVSDYNNNRVLRFDDAANLSNGALASSVLGQSTFLASAAPASPTASTMNHPTGVATDASGALWVSDGLNSRVLRFANAASLGNAAGASTALGQPDLVTNGAHTTQDGISAAFGIWVDSSDALWVADTLNHRVLHYTPQTVTAPAAAAVTLKISGRKKLTTAAKKIIIKGTASCADGIARIEYRVGKKGGFHIATGTASWSFKAKLNPGKNLITIHAIGTTGKSSAAVVIVKRD